MKWFFNTVQFVPKKIFISKIVYSWLLDALGSAIIVINYIIVK